MSEIRNISEIGPGQMGRGIAQVAAFYGFKTMVYDVSSASLKNAQEFIGNQLMKSVEKGKMTQVDMERTQKGLNWVASLEQLKDADLVIEAASENKSIKFPS